MSESNQNRDERLCRLRDEASPTAMDEIIRWAKSGDMTDADILGLARTLAESGEMLSFETDNKCVDVASTGGPSSLSTLLCPIYLRCLGASVPKLGVPGRPAGAVDVLAQIPGFRVLLSSAEVTSILDRCGYAHFLATGRHAPLDGALFQHRRRAGAIAVPELAIASLLSKKLAVGLHRVGLDVRVSPFGNFGSTWTQAQQNARRFVYVAAAAGIEARCFLTDGKNVCQPFIGRGEALLGLAELAADASNKWLLDHARVCFRMAQVLLGKDAADFPSSTEVRIVVEENLAAQGSSWHRFEEKVDDIRRQPRSAINARARGFFSVDLERIRHALVTANAAHQTDDPAVARFSDAAGLILHKRVGTDASPGDLLAELRCPETVRDTIIADVQEAFTIAPDGGERFGFEVV